MRYLNAAEAARALGIGDKTIRRWLKDGRKFPSAIVKANGEWAIPEDEVEAMRQHRLKYASVHVTSHDQTDVSILAAKLAALEQEVATLKQGNVPIIEQAPVPSVSIPPIDAIPQTEDPQNRATIAKKEGSRKRAYKPRDTGLPAGCLTALDFARNHDVKRETFRDHMLLGLGPGLIGTSTNTIPERDHVEHETRPKPGREKETERYLTTDQQAAAIQFWKRHDVSFAECNDFGCWCHTLKNGE